MVEVEHSSAVHQHSLLAVVDYQMHFGIFLAVCFDEEAADTRLDARCYRNTAVAEEDSRLDLRERAVAAEGGMIAEVEESQAR